MKRFEKFRIIAFLILTAPGGAFAAGIGSTNDLVSLSSGAYKLPSGKNNGFVTSDNKILNKQWYAEMTIKFSPNWRWGTSEYEEGDHDYANVKLFRMWNPGPTKENFYVEFSGRERGGVFKFAIENVNNSNVFNEYSTTDNLNYVLRGGTTHKFQFDFKDSEPYYPNGRFRMWMDGQLMCDLQGLPTRTNGGLKRIFILGLQNEWGRCTNSFTLSNVVMAEGKTYEQMLLSKPKPPTKKLPQAPPKRRLPPPRRD